MIQKSVYDRLDAFDFTFTSGVADKDVETLWGLMDRSQSCGFSGQDVDVFIDDRNHPGPPG